MKTRLGTKSSPGIHALVIVSIVLLGQFASTRSLAQSDQFSTSGGGGNIVSDAHRWWNGHNDTFRNRSQQCLPLLAQAETQRLTAQDFYIEARSPSTPSRERSRLQAQGNAQYGEASKTVRQFYDCSGRAQSDQFQTQAQPQQSPTDTPRSHVFQLGTQVQVPREPTPAPTYPTPRQVGGISSGTINGGTSAGATPRQTWSGSRTVPSLQAHSGVRYKPERLSIEIRDMDRHPNERSYQTSVALSDGLSDPTRAYVEAYGTVDQARKTFTVNTLKDRRGEIIDAPGIVVQLQ